MIDMVVGKYCCQGMKTIVEKVPNYSFHYYGTFYTIKYKRKKFFGLLWGDGGTIYCYHCFWCGKELSKHQAEYDLQQQIEENNNNPNTEGNI